MRSLWAGCDPDGYFRRQAGRRDPFTVVFPGLGPVHFFSTSGAAHDLLTASSEALEAPTPNPIEPIVGADSIILISGDEHRMARRTLMPALHGRRMRARAETMARAASDECATWGPGRRVSLVTAARSIALRIIVTAMFGVDDAERYQEFADITTALMHANTAPLMLLPWLRRAFAGRGPWARLMRLRVRFDELLDQHVHHRPLDGADSSVLGVLLAGRRTVATDSATYQQVRTLVVAGHDTTAGALMWALYHIHRESEIRDRVMAELDDVVPSASLPDLPYLRAVVSETLRMHPAVPIVMRRLTAPLTVGGHRWRPGDIVGIAVPAVHFDQTVWPDPYRFAPERFLSRSPTPFEYLPFGGGFRRCPGAAFATYELAVAIGTLMKSVELEMPLRERRRRPPRSVPRGIAVAPSRDVRLDVIRRR